MANKNTKQRLRKLWKANKAAGFKTPVFKKKTKPFPKPNGDGPTLMEQREQFYNLPVYH